MKEIILLFSLLVLITCSYAQKTIAVLSGTTWTFYEDFSNALRQAPSGSVIYLPGGILNSSSGYDTIKRPLTIIGVGHFPDSTIATLPTIINSTIILEQGAASSSLIGLNTSNDIWMIGNGTEITNINIMRCKFNRIIDWFSTGIVLKNSIISECIINEFYGGVFGVNNLVEKSIINYVAASGDIIFRNNIIFGAGNQFNGIQNGIFINNIIGTSDNMSSCFLQNNIFLSGTSIYYPQLQSLNNMFSTPSNTFINVPILQYDISYNYNLKSSSVGKNAGTDGTDIGIYGTSKPCKDGWVPYNPHISYKTIPSESLPNGTLPVNVKVVAQDR